MWHDSARIDSPDVIRDFRYQFVKFIATAKQAVTGTQTDCQRISQWVTHDQASYWAKELKRREDLYQKARMALNLARDKSSPYAKTSIVDEQKALRKAETLRNEAEQKAKAVKKWSNMLERELENLTGPVNNLASVLEASTPRALAKLDLLMEKLEEYLKMAPPE